MAFSDTIESTLIKLIKFWTTIIKIKKNFSMRQFSRSLVSFMKIKGQKELNTFIMHLCYTFADVREKSRMNSTKRQNKN